MNADRDGPQGENACSAMPLSALAAHGVEPALRTPKKQNAATKAAFLHSKAPRTTAKAAARAPRYQQSPTRLLLTLVVMPWPAMSMVLVTVFSVGEM